MFALRELSRNDLKAINLWRSDRDLISFLGAPFRFIDLEVDERWFDSYLSGRGNTIRCAIYDDSDRDTILWDGCLVVILTGFIVLEYYIS